MCWGRQNKWKNGAKLSELEKQSNTQEQSRWGTERGGWTRGKKGRAELKPEKVEWKQLRAEWLRL